MGESSSDPERLRRHYELPRMEPFACRRRLAGDAIQREGNRDECEAVFMGRNGEHGIDAFIGGVQAGRGRLF